MIVLLGFWTHALAALLYALVGARRCLGPFHIFAWRFAPWRLARMARETALPTLSDFASGLYVRLDLYLVALMLGEAPAGVYGMARQLRNPLVHDPEAGSYTISFPLPPV